MHFSELGLTPAIAGAATELGFTDPTPVQAEAIPAALGGADVLASAQTGSGKTAAFALPVLQQLQAAREKYPQEAPLRIRALVLVPTRELAGQVGDVFRSLTQHLPLPTKVTVVFGGVSINPQMMGLRGGADVVIATPGRLLDLVEHNALKLAAVATLVLDEADRLLDLGFAEELNRVLALLPERRQNLFFSATFPPAVEALASALLREPVRVQVQASEANDPDIAQRAIQVDPVRRTELLRHVLKQPGCERALVFVATQYSATHVAWKLYKNGVYATPFHGGLSQGARTQVLEEFKNGQWDVLVTTDLASRGLDIVELPLVINYDLPRSAVDYVHRIGRTGRAGESGRAISFVSAGTEAHFRLIEKRQGMALEREQVEGFEPLEVEAASVANTPPGTGGVKGKRPSKKDKLRAAQQAAVAGGTAAPSASEPAAATDADDAGTPAADQNFAPRAGGSGLARD